MISLLLLIGCFKTYIIDGKLRDTNGRPVNNAIVRVPQSELETRSDKKGRFHLEIPYKKKLVPYTMVIKPLAHEEKTTNLELETTKEKEIEKKIILEPKKIFLPYSSVNLDVQNTVHQKKEEPAKIPEDAEESTQNEEPTETPTENGEAPSEPATQDTAPDTKEQNKESDEEEVEE